MKIKRSNKKLLKILRENVITRISTLGGICIVITYLKNVKVISPEEAKKLRHIIDEYYDEINVEQNLYWWPSHELEPRVQFLDMLIAKYENQSWIKIAWAALFNK
jgi:hypothetical protein